jgi:hypothetical protein
MSSKISQSEPKHNSSNTGSINQEFDDDDNESVKIEEIKSVSDKKSSIDQWMNDGNNIEKVTPYSIRNLTNYKINVVNSDQYMMADNLDNNLMRENSNSLPSRFQDPRLSTKVYELDPCEECEYAIDYEKQTTDLMNQNRKKKERQSESAQTGGHLSSAPTEYRKTRGKNQELVNILFDQFQPILNIDLNKIQSYKCYLEPFNS